MFIRLHGYGTRHSRWYPINIKRSGLSNIWGFGRHSAAVPQVLPWNGPCRSTVDWHWRHRHWPSSSSVFLGCLYSIKRHRSTIAWRAQFNLLEPRGRQLRRDASQQRQLETVHSHLSHDSTYLPASNRAVRQVQYTMVLCCHGHYSRTVGAVPRHGNFWNRNITSYRNTYLEIQLLLLLQWNRTRTCIVQQNSKKENKKTTNRA